MKKISEYKIPVSKPYLTKDDFLEIKKSFDSSWISSKSPWVDEFEKAFAKKISCTRYAASVNSGTSALFLALKALGIKEGDEVILPTLTMIASINAVVLAGAKPILVDCAAYTDFNFDLDEVERKITKRTKAIMPVHLYGYSCEMDKLMQIAKKHKLFVIEDAAEAMGSTYKEKVLGSFGDISCYSLYSNKIITTGNGGMVVTDNKKTYEAIKKLRFFDFNENAHFTHKIIGFNLVLSGLQAALGYSQVKKFEKLLAKRRLIFKLYLKYLKENNNFKFIFPNKGQNPNYWFPAIVFKNEKLKKQTENILKKNKIEPRIFFVPLHKQPVYKKYFKNEKYPIAEYFYKNGLLLPSFYELTKKDIQTICGLINKIK